MADPGTRITSGAYGSDTPLSLGRGATDERGRLYPEALRQVWDEVAPYYSGSRARIKYTNAVTSGKKRAPVPRKQARNRDIYAPRLPAQFLRSLHNHNVIGRREPRLKRYTSGIASTPLERASRIEQWVNPMMLKLCSWDELTGMIQNEAEMASIVAPADVVPRQKPPPFRVDDDDPDSPVLPEWWRDGDGRGVEHYAGREHVLRDGRDGKKTREAYEQAVQEWRLDNPTIDVRLIHAEECVPVGLRMLGDGPHIEGLLVRSLYSRVELIRRQFRWGKGPSLEAMTATGPRDVELYEGWLTDASGLPYVVYSVQGMATRWADGEDRDWAMIDLFEDYGQTRLLAFYEYGWHLPVRDPDARGVPFAFPFADGDLASQAMIGAAVANFYTRGYGARGIKMNPNAPREAYLDGSTPRQIDWEPGGALPVLPGEIQDILPQVISPDAWKIIDVLQGMNAQEGPPPGAYGGAGPESGRERTVIRRHVEDSQAQILSGSLRMWQKIGIGVLELATLMTRRGLCDPIPVATTVPIAVDGQGNKRKGLIVTLNPVDVQGNYALEAYFQPQPGDNLALAEQAKGLVQAGLRPRRWFHEVIMGDEQPEMTEAEIASDAMVFGPEGQAEIRELAMRIRNDERAKQLKGLRDQGRVSPSGAPLAMAGGLQGPSAAPGGPPVAAAGGPGPLGTGLPSPGAAALGGDVAAGMETQAILGDARALASQGPPVGATGV